MNRLLKIIFWTSISIVILVIIFSLTKQFLPLEFESDDDELVFENFRLWCLPIVILLTLTKTLKHKESTGIIIGKIGLTILIALIPVFIMFITAFDGLCGWATEKILFENKVASSKKIVLRSFGCGAVDASAPTFGVFKVRNLPFHLVYITKIDTSKIDKREWKRIEGDEK